MESRHRSGSEGTCDLVRSGSIRENPSGKHGAHRYDPHDFGLDPTLVRARFAGYAERYLA